MVKVKEVMRSYVVTVGPKATLDEVARIMDANKIGSVVIVDKESPVGIITDSDIVSAAANKKSLAATKVSSIASKKLVTTFPEEDLLKAVRTMVKSGVKRLPVVDKGRLVGILTDKEVLLTTPEMVEVLSERLKARTGDLQLSAAETISGICEECEAYSDNLKHVNDKWLCEDCRQ